MADDADDTQMKAAADSDDDFVKVEKVADEDRVPSEPDSDDELEDEEEDEEEEDEEEQGPTWEELKEQGNDRFRAKNYRGAIDLYTQAIEKNPNLAALYGNRSAAALMLGRHGDVIADCKRAVALDPEYVKGYHRCAKASMATGDFETTIAMYRQCLLREKGNKVFHNEKNAAELAAERLIRGEKHLGTGKFTEAVTCCEQVLRVCPAAKRVKLMHVNALNGAGQCDAAFKKCTELLRDAPRDAELLSLRARCLYLQGDFEKAMTHLKHALRSDPDNRGFVKLLKQMKAMESAKAAANRHFKFARWQEAVDAYGEALAIDPENRGFSQVAQQSRDGVREDAATRQGRGRLHQALELDPSYTKAPMRRATCLGLGEIENQNAVCVNEGTRADWRLAM